MGGDAIPVIKKRRLSFCFYIIYIVRPFENFRAFLKKINFFLNTFLQIFVSVNRLKCPMDALCGGG